MKKMDRDSQLKNYEGLVNLMIFLRWVIIASLGLSLIFILGHQAYLLVYSITVFCVFLGIEIIITIAIYLFKRKIRPTTSEETEKDK